MLINHIWLERNNSRTENVCKVKPANLLKTIITITSIKNSLKLKLACNECILQLVSNCYWLKISRAKSYEYATNAKLVIPTVKLKYLIEFICNRKSSEKKLLWMVHRRIQSGTTGHLWYISQWRWLHLTIFVFIWLVSASLKEVTFSITKNN